MAALLSLVLFTTRRMGCDIGPHIGKTELIYHLRALLPGRAVLGPLIGAVVESEPHPAAILVGLKGGDAHRLGRDAAQARDGARRVLATGRGRYERSWVQDLVRRLKILDLTTWTTVFGAELLWSVLPLLILLSSLANHRVDDDLSRHIGVSGHGVAVVRALFRGSPTFSVVPIVTGSLFALVGTVTVVGSLQVLYERAFDQQHRGWRDIPRFVVWVGVLLGALIIEGIVSKPVRTATGPVVEGLVRFIAAMLFSWWTMHFLLAGRVPWRALIRPALVTAILWIVLAVFSSLSLSSSIVDDSKLYGTIGVVFTILTWFILVASVLVLGAALGAVWQDRAGQGFASADGGAGQDSADEHSAGRNPASSG